MKCKVIRRFIDKASNKLIEKDTTFDCSKERFNEIQAKGNFLVEIREAAKTPEKPSKTAKKIEE